jgi:hypothetical protein
LKKVKYYSFLVGFFLFISSIAFGESSGTVPPMTWPTCDLYYGTDINKYLNEGFAFNPRDTYDIIYHHKTSLLIKNADMGRISPDGKHIVYVGLGPYLYVRDFSQGKVGKVLTKYPWGLVPIWLDNDNVIFAEVESEIDKTEPYGQQYFFSKGLRKYTISTNQFAVLTNESDIPNDVSYDGETVLFCRAFEIQPSDPKVNDPKTNRMGQSWIMHTNKDFSMRPKKFIIGQDALFVIGESRKVIVSYAYSVILLDVDDNFKDNPAFLNQKMITSDTWSALTSSITKNIYLADHLASDGSQYWYITKSDWLLWKDEGGIPEFNKRIAGGSETNGNTKNLHLRRGGVDFVVSQFGDYKK